MNFTQIYIKSLNEGQFFQKTSLNEGKFCLKISLNGRQFHTASSPCGLAEFERGRTGVELEELDECGRTGEIHLL